MTSTTTIERKALIKRSLVAKEIQRSIMQETGEIISINQILKAQLHNETGAKVLLRFDEWSKAGFTVKRSSKSVRIWGKKINSKQQRIGFNSKKYSFYPMCCLFSEDQVIPLSEDANLDYMVKKHAVSEDELLAIQLH